MFDTVVLRVHNFSNYTTLFNMLYAKDDAKNSMVKTWVDEETGLTKDIKYKAKLLYYDSDRFLPIIGATSHHIGSYTYAVSVLPNYERNTCEVNFSIPKALFGTNVMQFVDPYASLNTVNLRKKLFDYIKEFFKKYFYTDMNFSDLEMRRIDFCYNQFFYSKSDALKYIASQSINAKKFAKSSSNTGRTYGTGDTAETIYYTVKNQYTWKIYHKGTEFKKHDYKKLCKNNNIHQYNMDMLLDESDKILRYELEFRPGQMKYLFDKHFNPGCSNPEPADSQYRVLLMNFDKDKNSDYQKFLSSKKRFFLAHIVQETQFPDSFQLWDNLFFSQNLFDKMMLFFWDKCQQYQLDKTEDIFSIIIKIKETQDLSKRAKKVGIKRKAVSTQRLLYPALLSKFMSLELLKKHIPDNSFYTLKRDLKAIGFTTNGTFEETLIKKPVLKNYEQYFLKFGKYHKKYN